MSDQTIAYTVVDAFTSKPFTGNPASIIVMDRKETLSTETMQLIAREFNLSETAFLAALPNTKENDEAKALTYSLRWFTPLVEVKLCGHATLASAATLFANDKLVPKDVNNLLFETLSGTLKASKIPDGRIELTFPTGEVEPVPSKINEVILPQAKKAVGEDVKILGLYQGVGSLWEGWLLVEVDSTDKNLADLSIKPDVIANMEEYSIVIVTAKGGKNEDFVSRVFGPKVGVAEDPVTGSAHCLSGPFWAKKLNTPNGHGLIARQVSARGGEMEVIWNKEKGVCNLRGEVKIIAWGKILV